MNELIQEEKDKKLNYRAKGLFALLMSVLIIVILPPLIYMIIVGLISITRGNDFMLEQYYATHIQLNELNEHLEKIGFSNDWRVAITLIINDTKEININSEEFSLKIIKRKNDIISLTFKKHKIYNETTQDNTVYHYDGSDDYDIDVRFNKNKS